MGHTEEISTLALQHDGLVLASASGPADAGASQICLWNIQDGICKKVCNNFDLASACKELYRQCIRNQKLLSSLLGAVSVEFNVAVVSYSLPGIQIMTEIQ